MKKQPDVELLGDNDARLLGEAPNHPTSFVTGESTIRVMFVTKDPFARNYVGTGRRRN
jgi:hypothetical protein